MMGPAERELNEALNALNLEVDQSIVGSIREKARAALDESRGVLTLAEFNPQPGVRIVATLPLGTPREVVQAAAESMKRNFPDHSILFKTEGWELEAEEAIADAPDGSSDES
jgi:UDP-N-acetyl-D-mannosaminuronic acid transferase (WecB/TagA/CpsF family)